MSLGGSDVGIVHFSRKLQARQSLTEMSHKRTDHDEHERLTIPAKRILKEVRQLS